MFKNLKLKNVVLFTIIVFLVWFFVLRTNELTVTYDSVETYSNNLLTGIAPRAYKATGVRNESLADTSLSISNALDSAPLYEEDVEEGETSEERYRENRYYRVDTKSFDELVKSITKDIEDLKGIIKNNNQNSMRKVVFDKEFYPKWQNITFTIDNKNANTTLIEETLKKYGDIRISNSNKTSIEAEITRYEQELKEMEEARKALKESKDKDWIARRDSELAKQSERIKSRIENAKNESTYVTYNVDIYEVLKHRVNATRYWYSNNYSLKNAVEEALPSMIKIFALLMPITIMGLVLLVGVVTIIKGNKKRYFEEQIDLIKDKFKEENIHFDIKM